MNTLLSAIKKYPREFTNTLMSRARTTPSDYNRTMHLALAAEITNQDWDAVIEILEEKPYRNGLEGVVFCLDLDYDFTEKSKIIKLFEEGKLF